MDYRLAEGAKTETEKEKYIKAAFAKFDRLIFCLNHIFEQFSVNAMFTRSGLVPRQDKKIEQELYTPTLKVLSDPKWKTVSANLDSMFVDYQEKNYPEVITKAHSAIQRFLQILVGEEGKNGKGELAKLFSLAKAKGIIPPDRFTAPIINSLQGFIPSERASKSTAKPAIKVADQSDALLMMNVVMILVQHCLQNAN